MDNIDFAIASPKKRYEQVVESLEKVIMRSAPDEKLPPEQTLAERFSVSKSVIREALTVLKDRGLVQSRNGDGSYVSKPNTDTVVNAIGRIVTTSSISDHNLHETRLILETATIRLAAQNATPEELDRLETLLVAMSDLTLSYDEWLDIDMDFHVAIAKAGRNELLTMFVEVMMCLLKNFMLKALYGKYDQNSTLREHRDILDALRTGNPDRCQEAVRAHLLSAWNNLSDYLKERGTSDA